MKNHLLIFLSFALSCLLGGCICDDEPECCQPSTVTVETTVCVQDAGTVTRTADESTIADINFFFCGPDGLQHLYSTAPTLRFECSPGAYALYVIVNAHTDLRSLSLPELESYAVSRSTDCDDLPMTARRTVTIPVSPTGILLPAIEVERAVARIDYDITVDDAASDISIRSVQAMHLPIRYYPFAEGSPSTTFIDDAPVENVSGSAVVGGSFYMLPNCQGTRPQITSPEQKNPANAPDNAACLHIRALRGGKVLDYYIYLGENDTSDFNVRANTVHTLHIRILGDEDLRLRQYAVDVSMTSRSQPQDGFMTEHLDGLLSVRLSGHYDDMGIRATLALAAGDAAMCAFNGAQAPLNCDLSSGALDCTATYRPETFTRSNAHLKFTLTLSDKYGEVGQYDFEYVFAYAIHVYHVWHNGPRFRQGRVVSEDALGIVGHETLSAVYDAVYCTAEGCTLAAEPNDGYAVDCWGSNPGHMGELSYGPVYRFVPKSVHFPETVYLFFASTRPQMEAGSMKGRETLVLDLSAGDTFSILGSEMIFSRSTSDNGMVEYVFADEHSEMAR